MISLIDELLEITRTQANKLTVKQLRQLVAKYALSCKLVWITPDAEKLVGKIARVSNPANEDNPEVEKLIRYLIKHKHWSPFEMASMCVEITTTRAIAPQILRHRSFSFQEFSQRYAVAVDAPIPQIRRQDKKNRQNSIDDFSLEERAKHYDRINMHFEDAFTSTKICLLTV